MREQDRKRQKAYWEIAAAMVTLGYRDVTAGDVEDVDHLVRAGQDPTGPAGREIAAALGNYFNDGGAPLSPPGEDPPAAADPPSDTD